MNDKTDSVDYLYWMFDVFKTQMKRNLLAPNTALWNNLSRLTISQYVFYYSIIFGTAIINEDGIFQFRSYNSQI